MNKHVKVPEQEKARTSIDIAKEQQEQVAEQKAAQAELDQLQAVRHGMLLTVPDDVLDQHDGLIRKAGRRLERSVALQAKLTTDRAKAEYEEDQARRRANYDAAMKAKAEAEDMLRKEYPSAAARIATALRRVDEARAQVHFANNDRPDGFGMIGDPEDFRGRQAREGERKTRLTNMYFDEAGRVYAEKHVWPDRENPGFFIGADPARPNTTITGLVYRELETVEYVGRIDFQPSPRLGSHVILPNLMYEERDYIWDKSKASW